jgi:hypothetical protein
VYPGTNTPAFTDRNFYSACGKTGASGTIRANGCAICALATFALYKGGLKFDNGNVFSAVKEAAKKATNASADFTYASFSADINSVKVDITLTAVNDMAEVVQSGGICIVRMKQGVKSHFLLVDGFDKNASGLEAYLVADPNGGALRNMKQAMGLMGIPDKAEFLVKKFKLS